MRPRAGARLKRLTLQLEAVNTGLETKTVANADFRGLEFDHFESEDIQVSAETISLGF